MSGGWKHAASQVVRHEPRTSMVDAVSMDGTKPLPSVDELVQAEDLTVLQAEATARLIALKGDIADAARAFEKGIARLPAMKLNALRRTVAWYQQLIQLCMAARSVQARARKQAKQAEQADTEAAARAAAEARRAAVVAEAEERDRRDERAFVAAAKRLLTGAQFQAIWDEVNRGKDAR